MIQLKDFSIGFNHKTLLKKIFSTFSDSSLTALIGRNGSGKSTLMKAMCGLNDKYEGEILIDSKNLRNIPRNQLAKKIAYVNTQRPRMANLYCRDVVALGRTPYVGWHGTLSVKDKEMVEEALEKVDMLSYKDRLFNSLSDGESQKIMIARAIAQDTEIIILDEPTSFLDLPTRYELVSLLKSLTEEKEKTIIFSTHELDIALKFSDYISLIHTPDLINLTTAEMIAGEYLDNIFPSVK